MFLWPSNRLWENAKVRAGDQIVAVSQGCAFAEGHAVGYAHGLTSAACSWPGMSSIPVLEVAVTVLL